MTEAFVKRNSREFFRDKKATVLCDQTNIGKEIIKQNEVVTILCKNQVFSTELDIKSESGVYINGVNCQCLELIKYKKPTEEAVGFKPKL